MEISSNNKKLRKMKVIDDEEEGKLISYKLFNKRP